MLLGILASSRLAAAGDYESIATVTVGSGGASTVTFNSIPSNYAHLQFRISARSTISGTSSDNIAFRINGDSGANYSTHNLYGTGAGAFSAAFAGLNYAYFPSCISSAGNLSNVFAGVVADFLDYSNTSKNTTIRALAGYDENANSGPVVYDNRIQLSSAFWNNTAAVNSIVFQTSGSFAQHSHFALYGIKAA